MQCQCNCFMMQLFFFYKNMKRGLMLEHLQILQHTIEEVIVLPARFFLYHYTSFTKNRISISVFICLLQAA